MAYAQGSSPSSPNRIGVTPYRTTPIGYQQGESLVDPMTGAVSRTGAQRGTDAGLALRALAEASGLPLLGGSSSSASGAGAGGSGVAALPAITMPDTSAASAAAFGRAKDQAGQTARASLTALRNELASRNMLGSGVEGGETARILGEAAGGANEVSRDQAILDAKLANERAKTEYQGRITQRSQDINAAEANAARQAQSIQGLLEMIGGRGILY